VSDSQPKFRKGAVRAVHAYLASRVGQTVYVPEMTTELQFTYRQIGNAITYLKRDGRVITTTIQAGTKYRVEKLNGPPAPPVRTASTASTSTDGQLFEEIGRTKSGDILVESENHIIYRLIEL
jgi:hypothetical protein